MSTGPDDDKAFWDVNWHSLIHPPVKFVFEGWWSLLPVVLGLMSFYVGLRIEEIEARYGALGKLLLLFGFFPGVWYVTVRFFLRRSPSE